jgi:hypothetical protein
MHPRWLSAFAIVLPGRLAGMPEFWKPHVLRQYAFIADGERGAAAGREGMHLAELLAAGSGLGDRYPER